MRYDSEKNRILVTDTELVSIARRGVAATDSECKEDEKIPRPVQALLSGGRKEVKNDFTVGKWDFSLLGTVYNYSLDTSTRVAKFELYMPVESPNRPRREETEIFRGRAFVLAEALRRHDDFEAAKLTLHYVNPRSGEINTLEEIAPKKKLTAFFAKCEAALFAFAKPEVERVTVRLPSMKNMRFPFPKIRDGQRSFIHAAHRTLARHGKLFAEAPTGTGKTVAALYPTLRAIGEEKYDKLFYLTPKSTIAEAAADCLELFSSQGAKIRAVIITAKERACIGGGVCREDKRLCQNSRLTHISEAALALYNLEKTVIKNDDIRTVAKNYKVCPYELSLTYAELCDAVICDENYLFDPHVYIRRFFDAGERYAVLVDEAHNLAERAREMYSATLSTSDLDDIALLSVLGEHSELKKALSVAKSALCDTLFPYVKDEIRDTGDGNRTGAAHTREIPSALYTILDTLAAVAERELHSALSADDSEARERAAILRETCFSLSHINEILEKFDTGYEMFIFFENGEFSVRLFCLDTGRVLSERLSRVGGAVLFSATLTPIEYYKSVLGGDRSDDTLLAESPFDPSQLSVSIVDSVSTRFSEREETSLAALRVIAATVSAKRGNYIVFSPSFAYSDTLARAFKAKHPKLRTLVQRRNMSYSEREEFLGALNTPDGSYLVAFCVMGGIFAEGIDLVGDKLIGAMIIGIGIPQLSYEREAIAAYYQDKYEMGKEYAYLYPGMNRVFQAAGRVIRHEGDKGVIVLIDDRFRDPLYKKSLPRLWSGVHFISNPKELRDELDAFWQSEEK